MGHTDSHRIRLRGPWKAQPEDGSAPPIRITVPETADARPDCRGPAVVYRRVFHCPTGLEPNTRVTLVVAHFLGRARVRLDGRMLSDEASAEPPLRIELTPHLSGVHRLEIVLEASPPPLPRLTGEVFLEITPARS